MIVAYHGSERPITGPFKNRSQSVNMTTFGPVDTSRRGVFFSDNPEFAAQYGSHVEKYNLDLSNTAEITRDLVLDFAETIDPFGPERDLWVLAKHSKADWGLFEGGLGERFVDWLESDGYDSASFEESIPTENGEVEGTTYVVFSPQKIRKSAVIKLDLHRITALSRVSSTAMFFGDKSEDIVGDFIGVRTMSTVHGGKVILMDMTEREWENMLRGVQRPVIAEDGEKWNSTQEWQQDMVRDGWKLVWMTPARQRQEGRRWRDWVESKEKMDWPKELTEGGHEQLQRSRERAEDLKKEQW